MFLQCNSSSSAAIYKMTLNKKYPRVEKRENADV